MCHRVLFVSQERDIKTLPSSSEDFVSFWCTIIISEEDVKRDEKGPKKTGQAGLFFLLLLLDR